MKKKGKHLPIMNLFPNFITLSSLCFGLFALHYGFTENWERAALFIIFAAILDVLDGRFARMLGAQSKLGAQLDSLCDFANFGIFPVLIIYDKILSEVNIAGWCAVMIVVVCACVRLARFNVESENETDEIRAKFFKGVPSPMAGILILFPIILEISGFEFEAPIFWVIYTAIIGLLMPSTIPTLSTKKLHIHRSSSAMIMILVALIAVFIFATEWFSVLVFMMAYLISIPVVYLRYQNLVKKHLP